MPCTACLYRLILQHHLHAVYQTSHNGCAQGERQYAYLESCRFPQNIGHPLQASPSRLANQQQQCAGTRPLPGTSMSYAAALKPDMHVAKGPAPCSRLQHRAVLPVAAMNGVLTTFC
jgi:hypothetical protein